MDIVLSIHIWQDNYQIAHLRQNAWMLKAAAFAMHVFDQFMAKTTLWHEWNDNGQKKYFNHNIHKNILILQ